MRASVYEQLKQALQDILAPELKALQVEIKRLDEKIDSNIREPGSRINGLNEKMESGFKRLDDKIDSVRAELLSEIRRLDTRVDSLERELSTAIELRERISAIEAKLGL